MSELFNIPHIITNYGYIGISLIVFFESGIFFALPGDSLLFTAGILASSTYLHLYWLIPIIFVSTFLGGIAGYVIGVYIESLHHFSFFRKILKKEHLDKAHTFFDKHGKFAIIFSRFVPIVRTFTPIVAGIAKMHRPLFIRYSLISSLLWSTLVTLIGYFLGRTFPRVINYMTLIIISVVLLSLLPGIIHLFKNKRKELPEKL